MATPGPTKLQTHAGKQLIARYLNKQQKQQQQQTNKNDTNTY